MPASSNRRSEPPALRHIASKARASLSRPASPGVQAADKLGIGLIEDEESRVIISRLYAGYIASNSATLFVGDVLLAVNGQPIPNQETALKLLIEAVGTIEVRLQRTQDPGCWVLRYYDAKNSVARVEKGTIRLNRESIREINKYTLQAANARRRRGDGGGEEGRLAGRERGGLRDVAWGPRGSAARAPAAGRRRPGWGAACGALYPAGGALLGAATAGGGARSVDREAAARHLGAGAQTAARPGRLGPTPFGHHG